MSKLPFFHLVKESSYKDKPSPLLVMVHGYGSNEDDLFSFAQELPDTFLIVSLQAPHAIGSGSFAWYSINFDDKNGKFSDLKQAKESIDQIAIFIDEIKITPVEFADQVLKIALTKELKRTEWVEVDLSKNDNKSQASIQ